jgi:uncharacterized phiE125 gp8 family phage protein
MRVFVVTPPAPVVTWADADKHLRFFGDPTEQAYVESLIEAATATIDGPDGWLGRALGAQTLEARFDSSESCHLLELPCRPIRTVLSVKYLDANKQLITADPAGYELFGSELAPDGEWQWQGGFFGRETIRVQYVAGYATLPAPIRAAILLMVGDLFANRQTVVPTANATAVPMSLTVESLLQPYRVFR